MPETEGGGGEHVGQGRVRLGVVGVGSACGAKTWVRRYRLQSVVVLLVVVVTVIGLVFFNITAL